MPTLIGICGQEVEPDLLRVEGQDLVVNSNHDEKSFSFAGNRGNQGNWGWGKGYSGLPGFTVRLVPDQGADSRGNGKQLT